MNLWSFDLKIQPDFDNMVLGITKFPAINAEAGPSKASSSPGVFYKIWPQGIGEDLEKNHPWSNFSQFKEIRLGKSFQNNVFYWKYVKVRYNAMRIQNKTLWAFMFANSYIVSLKSTAALLRCEIFFIGKIFAGPFRAWAPDLLPPLPTVLKLLCRGPLKMWK